MTILVSAASAPDLRRVLANLDITVAARSQTQSKFQHEARTHEQTERYCAAYLLASLPLGRLAFPLRVEHRDRPDIVCCCNGRMIGVEVTEAVPTNAAHASAMRQSGVGPEVALITRSTPGEPKKTRAELVAEIEADLGGLPWEGDAPEREWADAMEHFAAIKAGKTRKAGYERFAANWLLIYDNWPLPSVRLAEASVSFVAKCMDADLFSTFDSVFVLSGEHLCEITAAGPTLHPIVVPSTN